MKIGIRTTFLCLFLAVATAAAGFTTEQGTVTAPDGVPIHYTVTGQGPAVVLVHCWSCDATYWDATVAALAADHRVVAVDLAGHGASGTGRQDYTMVAFAQDVVAVMQALDVRGAVVVGHSMGGKVAVFVADAAPDRVVGLIGVDTLHNVRDPFTREQIDAYVASWGDDFPGHVRAFIRTMFPAGADSAAVARVADDMAAAPRDIATSAFLQMYACDLPAAADRLRVPLWLINADTYPVAAEEWRAAGVDLHVDVIKGCGHFPMVTVPAEFHRLLRAAIASLQAPAGR
jgi:pimeloyl-ACP methyl ester carboxylesterase